MKRSRDPELAGWLRLARCEQLSPRRALALVQRAGGVGPFAAPKTAVLADLGLKPAQIRALCDDALEQRITEELKT
ncbi:MAG: hypothetical protein JSV80_09770, partial [Acidobacteriota bacterium]